MRAANQAKNDCRNRDDGWPVLPALPGPSMTAAHVQRLDRVPVGQACSVRHVHAPGGAPEWARQLEEIGFFTGEQVMVMTRGFPGGDPLVVRVGQSTFALRGAEAACIEVEPVVAQVAA